MKILYIALFDVNSCGPTSVMKSLIPHLISYGNEVDIFSPYPYSKDKEKLAYSLGCKYFFRNENTIRINSILESTIYVEKYDVVHIHGIYEPVNWIICYRLRKLKIPYVITIHGNLMENALKKSTLKKKIAIELFIRKMLEGSSIIHALADKEKKDIEKICSNKIVIIPNGVDKINIHIKVGKQNCTTITTFLYIGRIDINHKGLDLLMDAIKKLPNEYCNKIKIIMIGPIENDAKDFIDILRKNKKLSDIIEYLGPKYGNEKDQYYDKCDYFIHTSRYEGMPVAVLEALAKGMQCIVTKETNMEEIIENCNGGYIINCDSNSIRDIIIKILNSDSKNNKTCDFNWINKNLNWKIIAQKYVCMYATASKKTGGNSSV